MSQSMWSITGSGNEGSSLRGSQPESEEEEDAWSQPRSAMAVAVTQQASQGGVTTHDVLERIQELAQSIALALDDELMPVLETYETDTPPTRSITKKFSLSQCRSFTSILLVLNYSHSLLLSNRTSTNREVYYFYVTHFRHQKECDLAILDAATLLQVPRAALGFKASPRGWFCGDVQLLENDAVILDGRNQQSVQGSPIGSDWLLPAEQRSFRVMTVTAECILVVEKEGVYNRLSEDRFFDEHPCILVTGKGFPDLATRAFVHDLHTTLHLPVRGLADCDPFGCMVLNTYQQGSKRMGVDGGDRFSVPMDWVGLRPSQVEQLKSGTGSVPSLPQEVFQELTDLDQKRLTEHLLSESHRWTKCGQDERRVEELEDMRGSGYKVELEALNWLGMDFCSEWVGSIFDYHNKQQQHHDNHIDDESRISDESRDRDIQEWMEII